MGDISNVHAFTSLLPMHLTDHILEMQHITFGSHTIRNNVLAIPNDIDPLLFWVKCIVADRHENLYVITKEITAFLLYEEHFQAYRFHEDPANKSDCWRVLKFEELKSCYVSHVTDCGDGGKFIPKRWVKCTETFRLFDEIN